MRRTGLEFSSALAVASVVAALVMAQSLGLGFHDPDGSTGPTYVRLPAIVVMALILDVVPRAVLRQRSWSGLCSAVVAVCRERWTAASVRFMAIGLIGWYATYASIRNLKGWVPFANSHLYDADLTRLDRALFFGHSPAALLHDLMGTDIAAHVLSFFYLLWIVLLPASLAIALVWARRDRVSSWWVTAVSVDWVAGVALNYALPTVGPVYVRPQDYVGLASTATGSLQQSMWDERITVLADPIHAHTVQNIAAFASLHVAIATTACIVARRAGLPTTIVMMLRIFLGITMLATVYFGWHYVSDVVAGVLLGIAAAWVGERFAAPERESADDSSEVAASDLSASRPGE